MFYVYIIRLKNNQFYTGFTNDIKMRLRQHKWGENRTTKRIKTDRLEFFAGFKSKQKALEFETYLKSSSGFTFRNKHFIELR